ncbi:MAG: hypothetical protein A3I77_01755 [Gammaproteobacteria bacterium RIFCSPLOWO2_02_FULL_42_14]|nr:MAG: hypothetical protein A3B71_07940 [Gammaproteobacteria bacterium RIFCSPHIGHO2_02_FULL_42_43]OGT27983.1 MAG: hypothetical protein A2624_00730 [Gammaproteobacteria bacterium RIFCSPHIGHO2_01_FULL_42_8]OGT52348.1 MAG: hypothetical protein A3E54_01820 [Gammaproteobacteria bacterium RIFCSPHIGHO2_12_FULL_41_25]OGT61959.1 MAG: hypothetical protein A3I77_01755 [Gammaproteobacteria bacterium RIFCSPLOWO2_02_FULL_42_14]OGT86329.1 MAG: hypothetical protein A3G86_07335 [Gammaproteobacteria bacterium R
MLQLDHHFTSTYAKNLIADWSLLSRLMVEHTRWIRDVIQKKEGAPAILSSIPTDVQIDDALNGPLHSFFQSHADAWIRLCKIETALNLKTNEIFKDADKTIDMTFGIAQTVLDKADPAALKEKRKKLESLMQTHHNEWLAAITGWTTALLEEFKKNNIALTDLETADFTMNQPNSELNTRFIDLKLTLPKLSKDNFDFAQYFILKLTLALRSCLSRLQQPSSEKDIYDKLKLFQKTLKSIAQASEALVKKQGAALQ